MSLVKTLISILIWKSSFSISNLILVIYLLLPLVGCTGEGAGGPIISSLSTPMDATGGLNSDQPSNPPAADSDDEEDPKITMTSTPTGITAHLTWNRPSDMKATHYYIYYGKRSSEEPSSEESGSEESGSEESSSVEPTACSRGESQALEAPAATITGLEPNTSYFFVIRAINESESLCSNEFTVMTPPVES